MKTIVGVDHGGTYANALRLIKRLGLPALKLRLIHVEEPVWASPTAFLAPVTFPVQETIDALRQAGTRLLGEATELARSLEIPADSEYEVGHACSLLMSMADAGHYDLIAVGSDRKGSYGSFFLGSVGRGLATGAHQSFLVAKGQVEHVGKISIVFATDHSPYGDRAIQKFLEIRPSGIEKITLLTACERGSVPVLSPVGEREIQFNESREATKKAILEKGEHVKAQLEAAGYPTQISVVDGLAYEAIHAEMKATQSDLLVMGAQGHGFLERLFIGSIALHQVVSEPYSVLVLRA